MLSVKNKSNAMKNGGVMVGDYIVEVNGHKVTGELTLGELDRALCNIRPCRIGFARNITPPKPQSKPSFTSHVDKDGKTVHTELDLNAKPGEGGAAGSLTAGPAGKKPKST